MEFRFASPEAFYLLAALPFVLLLFWWDGRRRAGLMRAFAEGPLLEKLASSGVRWRRIAKSAVLFVAITALVLGLTRPQFGLTERTSAAKGIDLYVLIDVSRSMMSPANYRVDMTRQELRNAPTRLDSAKEMLSTLIRQLQGDRVGIIPFSSEAFVYCPLTLDHRVALDFLDEIDPKLVGVQGTNLGNAINHALDSFDAVESKADRAIVLITDGEDHGEDAMKTANRAAEMGVHIYTLGIGSEFAAPIPLEDGSGFVRGDEDNVVVKSRPDMELLHQIANATGGRSFDPSESTIVAIQEINQEIHRLKRAEREEKVFRVAREQFPWFLGFALILLVIEGGLADTPRRNKKWEGRFR